MMKLYSYFRSSASFRVRIALNIKNLPFEIAPVHLLKHGGDQLLDAYQSINPSSLVPVLEHDGAILTQSLAIIEYLEELFPEPALLPADPQARAYVRAAALTIACEVHPLNNLRVLRYLVHELHVTEDDKNAWYRHWVELGLSQLERLVVSSGRSGRYAAGDRVTLADVVIVPQIFNARRFECDAGQFPTLNAIADRCMELEAFVRAQPSSQPDAE